jgi:molybdopterin-guanine dinucleotide biosynthesis protein MobB
VLAGRGVRVGVIKHAHHNFDIDKPGKDSYELRKAGARQMLVASSRRWALMTETGGTDGPRLDELVRRLDHDAIDLVLVEGFKHVAFPRIELHRPSLGQPLLYPEDSNIIAVAADATVNTGGLARLDLNDIAAVAEFVLAWLAEQGDG